MSLRDLLFGIFQLRKTSFSVIIIASFFLITNCKNDRPTLLSPTNSASALPNPITQIVKGKIAHDIQRNMDIYKSYMTTVSISKSQQDSVLYEGLDQRRFTAETINVSSQVKVFLIDPSGGLNFKITPINNEEQFVSLSSNTVWKWNVMPITKGNNLLILRATVKIFNKEGNSFKDVNVFEKPITIKSSFLAEAKVFISNNWQYLLSTLVIPFGLWFFKRKKTKTA